MKIFRIVFLNSLLMLSLFASVGLGTGACGGMNALQSPSGSDAGYEGPVAIPVTIAKEVEGIDATTLVFTESSKKLELTRTKSHQRDASPIIGTISFNTINRTPTCQSVNVYINSSLINSLSAISDDCGYEYEVTEDQVDQYIAFTAQDTDSLNFSEPTIVEIIDTTDLYEQDVDGLPQYIMQVSVTNMSSSTETVTADIMEIRAASMTISQRGGGSRIENGAPAIIFAVESSDGIFLYSQWVTGGVPPEIFSSTAVPSPPLALMDQNAGGTFFLTQEGTFYTLRQDGTFISEDPLFMLPEITDESNLNASLFDVTLDQDYIIYAAQSVSGTLSPQLIEVGNDPYPCLAEEYSWSPDSLEVIFATELDILVTSHDQDGVYRVYHFNLTDALSNFTGTEYAITPEDLIESNSYMGNPVGGKDANGYYYYLCTGENGIRNICRQRNGTQETVVAQGVDVSLGSVSFSLSLSYLLFAIDTDPSISCYHTIETGETSCHLLGSHPFPIITNDGEAVGYISTVNGAPQVAIDNPLNTNP